MYTKFIIIIVLLVILVWIHTRPVYYFLQECTNGLGDRLLDICSAMSKNPNDTFVVNWNRGKWQERFEYDTDLIHIQNGKIVYDEDFIPNITIDGVKYHGTTVPTTEEEIQNYKKAALRIKPSDYITKLIPKSEYCAIHIRGTDKIIDDDDDPCRMSKEKFEYIRSKCIEYIKNNSTRTYFICTDDSKLKKTFMEDCGGDIKFIDVDYTGIDACIFDLFIMSNSIEIIQCTKYSTLSIVASLIGGCIPLVNFCDTCEKMGNWWDWGVVANVKRDN